MIKCPAWMRDAPGAEVASLSLTEAARMLRARSLSSEELVRACLARIDALDPTLNAFITVLHESAINQARGADNEIATEGWRGPLHGIPVAIKDLIDTAGVRTTAASNVFRDRVPAEDAEVVRRLKAAGAIIIGKTNLHEFAYGGSGVIGAFGPTRNPLDPQRIAGGSSSGSAAAVAAGMCFAAIGTDTAGSIRLPASYCGVIGLKPSYARVCAEGVIPLSWSFDHVGPIARSVEDVAHVLRVVSDRQGEAPNRTALSGLRVGVARTYFFEHVAPEIGNAVSRLLRDLEKAGAQLRDVVVPIDEDRTVHAAEAYAFHAELVKDAPQQYDPQTLARIRRGEHISATEYIQARRKLEAMRLAAGALFEQIDVIVTPTVPILPPTLKELQMKPDDLRATELLMLRNTRPFNVLGLPTVSMPCATTADGLSVGVQISAPMGKDESLLDIAGRFGFAG